MPTLLANRPLERPFEPFDGRTLRRSIEDHLTAAFTRRLTMPSRLGWSHV